MLIGEKISLSNYFYHVSFDQPEDDVMRRRILVVNNGSILEEGITRLLLPRIDLVVWSISFESMDALLTYIALEKPSVVVINRWFSGLEKLNGYLDEYRESKILIVSDDSNTITIYEDSEIHHRTIRDLHDFAELIADQSGRLH